MALSNSEPLNGEASTLYQKLRDIVLSTQYATESKEGIDSVAKSALRAFPQTALMKLRTLLAKFPPATHQLTPGQLAQLMLTIHPALLHAPFVTWAMMSSQTEKASLGPLGSPSDLHSVVMGLLGYSLLSVERTSEHSARVTFDGPSRVTLEVCAGPKQLIPFPLREDTLGLRISARFTSLLTSMVQAHALGWDISYIPPVLPSTASCSTTSLVQTFGAILGYEIEDVHMYKELGGRELVMHRKIDQSGATTWTPRCVFLRYEHDAVPS